MRSARIALAGLLALAAGPALAVPATLTCTAFGHLNWWSGKPRLFALGDARSEAGSTLFHLDPASGEWYRQLTGAASLTMGGGTFDIVRESEWRWYDAWVGVDGASMLRIRGGDEPLAFLMVDADGGVFSGTCVTPEEPFFYFREYDLP